MTFHFGEQRYSGLFFLSFNFLSFLLCCKKKQKLESVKAFYFSFGGQRQVFFSYLFSLSFFLSCKKKEKGENEDDLFLVWGSSDVKVFISLSLFFFTQPPLLKRKRGKVRMLLFFVLGSSDIEGFFYVSFFFLSFLLCCKKNKYIQHTLRQRCKV